jgi:RHS repeat-associated protein
MVTDASGDVVAQLEYGAWGELLDGSIDSVPGGMPYGFVGGLGVRTDALTGLIYMRARHYDPQQARFISKDPIGLVGGANLYAYPTNPLLVTDPSGLSGYEGGWTLDARIDGVDYYKRRDPVDPDVNEYTNTPQNKCPDKRKIKWPELTKLNYKWVPPPIELGPIPELKLPYPPYSWPRPVPRPPLPPMPLPPNWRTNGGTDLVMAPSFSVMNPLSKAAGILNAVWPIITIIGTEAAKSAVERAEQYWQRTHPLPYYDDPSSSGGRRPAWV